MLYLVLAYPIISAICLWAGWLFYQVLPSSHPSAAPYTRPIILYLLTGLMLLTGVAQCIVLLSPLGPATLLAILPVMGILHLTRRRNAPSFPNFFDGIPPKKRGLLIAAVCSLLLMILILNAGPTIMDDTDSYHIQMIKWIQEYGTVPGIANLHLRFGFNSSWFVAIALLCPRIGVIDQYLVLNGLLSLWFCYYFAEKIARSFFQRNADGRDIAGVGGHPAIGFGNPGLASCVLLAAGLLIWPLVRGNAASTNYDFIGTVCVLILLAESTAPSRPSLWAEWMIWPCFLFTIRIINAPLLLISVIAFLQYIRQYRKVPWSCGITATFFVLPFLARNFILSGYPLFPLYQFDFFAPDWKADRKEVIQITEYIRDFNRSTGNPEFVRGLSFPRWLGPWFRELYPYNQALVGLSLLSWIGIGWQWKKWAGRYTMATRGLILTLAGSILCWLFIAPDPRFQYGSLLAGPFLLILFFHPAAALSRSSFTAKGAFRKIVVALVVCLSSCIIFYSAEKIWKDPAYRNLAKPHPLPVPDFRTVKVDGILMRIPEKILDNWNPRCYGTPLPCLYRVNPRLHSRGQDIRDGFRLEGPRRGLDPSRPVGPDNPAEEDGEYKPD